MEFEISGNTYRAGKMDTFKQFHVSRRLAPVLGEMAVAVGAAKDDAGLTAMLQPLTGAIASMSDADCDFILQACLGVVQRQQGSSWAPVFAGGNKAALMFDDIDLGTMMKIAVQVIQDNLGGFFPKGVAAPATSAPPAA